MLTVVFDTNLAVSGVLTPGGAPGQVFAAWRRGAFRAVTSAPLLAELTDVLSRPHIRARIPVGVPRLQVLADLEAFAVEPLPLNDLPIHSRDGDDDMVLACALGAGADFIVTGDADLLALDGAAALGNLRIVTPAAFLAGLRTDGLLPEALS